MLDCTNDNRIPNHVKIYYTCLSLNIVNPNHSLVSLAIRIYVTLRYEEQQQSISCVIFHLQVSYVQQTLVFSQLQQVHSCDLQALALLQACEEQNSYQQLQPSPMCQRIALCRIITDHLLAGIICVLLFLVDVLIIYHQVVYLHRANTLCERPCETFRSSTSFL